MERAAASLLLLASVAGLCLTVSAGVARRPGVPAYIDCFSTDDCGTSECCVLGSSRYSIPTCRGRGEVGDACSPLAEPKNMSVSYLDSRVVQLVNVFSATCSCAPGLACDADAAACFDPLTKQSINELED